jgi:hypothetical protein
MKKLFPFLALAVFSIGTWSCKNDDDMQDYVDYDTYSAVYDLTNINFDFVDGMYVYYQPFENAMYDSDVILVYLQVGTTDGSPIWQQIPLTMYLSDGNEVDYNFDFSQFDLQLYAGGTFDLGGTSYVNNKTFRIVFVPGYFGKDTNELDYSDYNAVIKYFHIDDSSPVQLN